ncbi:MULTISPECIES: uracil phosphoribosyltransferase [Kordiimonadales]|uniref:Uracil phosphoribosyltransferase n=1 Tax=Gimibacter soli TaxID=3024400 RepID=A0AAF0BK00_9PROT|nr:MULTISPECIES: uracil phosphoribosyltransferase [Kordiimonadales]WCL53714.1 uracil phosphoribosyltransferase [Gimibacter soli]
MTASVKVVDHPLVQHKLTMMRRREASSAEFRKLLHEIGLFLGYEALKDLPLGHVMIDTPVTAFNAPVISGKRLTFISILRAGEGLLAPLLDLVPGASVGHIGLKRDEVTLQPSQYLFKVPPHVTTNLVIVLDPMLATGHSAIRAIADLKEAGARNIRFICLLAAPEGVAALQEAHPDVAITTAAIDEKLNDIGYIVPGLGDAGDRLFGTEDH